MCFSMLVGHFHERTPTYFQQRDNTQWINRQNRQKITFPGSAYPQEIPKQCTPATHTEAVHCQGSSIPVSDHWRLLDPPWEGEDRQTSHQPTDASTPQYLAVPDSQILVDRRLRGSPATSCLRHFMLLTDALLWVSWIRLLKSSSTNARLKQTMPLQIIALWISACLKTYFSKCGAPKICVLPMFGWNYGFVNTHNAIPEQRAVFVSGSHSWHGWLPLHHIPACHVACFQLCLPAP